MALIEFEFGQAEIGELGERPAAQPCRRLGRVGHRGDPPVPHVAVLRLGHPVRLALALQHQVHGAVAVAPAEQPDHEVGHVAVPHAADLVRHGPVEAEVACPGVHVGVLVEGHGDAALEAGVARGHVQLAASEWCPGRSRDGGR